MSDGDIGPQVAATLRAKVGAALAPQRIDIVDESRFHHGHAGARPGGGTHFAMTIVSSAFAGQSRLQRQRRVYEILATELKERVHALSLTTLTPEEDAASGVTRSTAI
jgi:BolA protein